MKPIWTKPLTWLVVVVVAVLLALATPRGIGTLGHLPTGIGKSLAHKAGHSDDDERPMMVLVSFHKHHKSDADSWVEGLALHQNRAISWIRMPVMDDPGDVALRAAKQERVHARYQAEQERSRLLPVFTDRPAFMQATGLPNAEHMVVLVLNRSGDVLARVAGPYDEDKARIVRDTLGPQDL